MDDQFVSVPDDLKLNDVNLYLSLIFYSHSEVEVHGSGHSFKIGGLHPNGTLIKVVADQSYWQMYLTHIITVLNIGPSKNKTRLERVTDSSSTSNNISNKRSFSTYRGNCTMVESYFTNVDDLTLWLARAYVPD